MLCIARSAQLVMVAALVMGVCHFATADDYANYPPPRPLAASTNVSPAASSNASRPPRLLPARYAAPEVSSDDKSGSEAAAGHPLPLSRQSSKGASPLGGLAGGTDSLIDAATSLGIVLGLFLLVVWAVRRGMPKGSGLLPTEAVEVLGRAPLAGRQQVHLVRCGNKIVLLSVAQSGTQALAEISDPAEVDRLHSICQPGSAGGLLRQFFGNFTGRAHSSDYYVREAANPDFRQLETGGPHRV